MTIEEFLTARIDEDERCATDTTEYQQIDEWDAVGVEDGDDPEIARSCWRVVEIAMPRWSNQSARSLMTHIARHDPARVRREVAAKRAIIEAADEATSCDMSVDSERRVGSRNMVDEPYVGDLILRALAAVYSDHPDYRTEWAV